MKEFDIYVTKAPVKVFGDMVNIYYRIFPIQELEKHIQELEIDDYHKQVILSTYEQNKKDNPNVIMMLIKIFIFHQQEINKQLANFLPI